MTFEKWWKSKDRDKLCKVHPNLEPSIITKTERGCIMCIWQAAQKEKEMQMLTSAQPHDDFFRAEGRKELAKEARKHNPYPDDVFLYRTKADWKVLTNLMKKNKLSPDGYFGDWGRKVWNICCDWLEKEAKR